MIKDLSIRQQLVALATAIRVKGISAFTATLLTAKIEMLIAQSTIERDDKYLCNRKNDFKRIVKRIIFEEVRNPKGLHHLYLLQLEWMLDMLSMKNGWFENLFKKAKQLSHNGDVPPFPGGEVKNIGAKGYKLLPHNEEIDYILPKPI